ncbi:hypothetical protein F5Y15DRAFT_263940 [Xylariaceae sp. FL0016]|nr:hypothetical protein F5Y15DRAFT_263940 [Xylariaceae sp. FL0016]
MADSSDTTPLLPRPNSQNPPPQSHPITTRVCHSPWHGLSQQMLFIIRLLLAAYLTAVFGVSLKYKLDNDDEHSKWRIPFQFSTVSFCSLWAYHLISTLWTGMHLFMPGTIRLNPEDCEGHKLRTRIVQMLSPSNSGSNKQFMFSMFYVISHVFAFMNTLIYWGVLLPAGHGGFQQPDSPHHHPGANETTVLYDQSKGLLEEGPIKPFSIINVWTITSLIAAIEVFFLNSIRRPTPVASHTLGVMLLSTLYLGWAEIGKLATGHAGIFFVDPELMNNMPGAAFAAGVAFVLLSPGIFAYMYGLIAMRDGVVAVQSRP